MLGLKFLEIRNELIQKTIVASLARMQCIRHERQIHFAGPVQKDGSKFVEENIFPVFIMLDKVIDFFRNIFRIEFLGTREQPQKKNSGRGTALTECPEDFTDAVCNFFRTVCTDIVCTD